MLKISLFGEDSTFFKVYILQAYFILLGRVVLKGTNVTLD